MEKKILEVKNGGAMLKIGVTRLRKADGTENIAFYFGDKLVLETSLSKFEKDKKRLSDCGTYITIMAFLELEQKIQKEFSDIPIYCEPNGYGYQVDENGIVGFAYSAWKVDNKNQPFIALEQKGDIGTNFLNPYIEGKIERQVILLHQLSAPVGAIAKHNHILVLAGSTSTGKTTIGTLTKSFFGKADSHFLGGNMNATISALENEIASLYGVPYYMDDASLVGEKFDWINFLYRLANGETKKRASYKEPNATVSTKKFFSHFLISSETSILDKIIEKAKELNSYLEGTLARVTEIEIKRNSSLLFDSEQQLDEVLDFYEDNYGNLAFLIVNNILEKGEETVKKEVRELAQEIIESNKIEDNLLKRKAKTIAIMVYTARIADNFGLKFDSDLIIKFMIKQTENAINSFAFSREKVYEIAVERLLDEVREKGIKASDDTYYLENKDYKYLIAELERTYKKEHFSDKKFKEYAIEKGVIIPIRDKVSGTFTCNGITGRGYHIRMEDGK